jgi:hypothetical protein
MKTLLISLALYCCLFAELNAQLKTINPQNYPSDWHEGSVVFNTGDTVACRLRYNQSIPDGILQIREAETTLTLPVNDVRSFFFYDSRRQQTRKFYSVAFKDSGELKRDYFMECLYNDDRFSILKHKTIGVNYDFMNYSRFISRHSRMIRQYILNRDTGELLPMSRENVLKLMDKRRDNVMSFIENNHIKFKSVNEYIDVFEYHRSL